MTRKIASTEEKKSSFELLKLIAQTLHDRKGSHILVLDVKGISSMTDYFVLAEGRVDRHVKGLARRVIDALAAVGLKPMHVEGAQTGEWIALDFWHVIIHLFTPAARDIYRLEGAWPKATIIDIPIDTSHAQEDDFE